MCATCMLCVVCGAKCASCCIDSNGNNFTRGFVILSCESSTECVNFVQWDIDVCGHSHYECVAHCMLNYSYHRHRWFPLILLLLHFISFVSFIFIFIFICSFVLFRFVSFCSSFFIIFAVEGSWPETGPFNIRTTYSTIFHTYSEGTLT